MTGARSVFWLLLLAGALAVFSTYLRLSPTADEWYHLACGMEWWEKGTYTLQSMHPPVTHIVVAAPYYLANQFSWIQNSHLATPRDAYNAKTWFMRLGDLPFYVFSCFLVTTWSRRLFGEGAALWSLALYVTLATVSAHAGLGNTDMGYATLFLWALMVAVEWVKRPGFARTILLGVCTGLMVGAKFSALVQWPAAMSLILMAWAWENRRRQLPLSPLRSLHLLRACALALPCFMLTLALIYRFSFAPLAQGIMDLWKFNGNSFALWLFGPLYNHSVWYFFPVVFFFKTPLPFHFLNIFAHLRIVRAIREGHAPMERLFPLLAAIGVLGVSMTSHLNLGVRHVLPLYPLLAVPAGYGLQLLWQGGRWRRAAAAGAIIWQLAGFAQAWPDFISYFNLLAGAHPERVSLDSDFDWGQGIVALNQVLHQRNISELYVCARKVSITPTNIRMLLDATALPCPDRPVTGWLAMSRATRLLRADDFAWLRGIAPVQPVGRTMDLYYIPAP